METQEADKVLIKDKSPNTFNQIRIDLLIPMYLASIRQLDARLNELCVILNSESIFPQEARTAIQTRANKLLHTRYTLVYTVMDLKPKIDEDSMYTDELRELFDLGFYTRMKK